MGRAVPAPPRKMDLARQHIQSHGCRHPRLHPSRRPCRRSNLAGSTSNPPRRRRGWRRPPPLRGVLVRRWGSPCLEAGGGGGGRVAQGVSGRRGGGRGGDAHGAVSFPTPVLVGREVGGGGVMVFVLGVLAVSSVGWTGRRRKRRKRGRESRKRGRRRKKRRRMKRRRGGRRKSALCLCGEPWVLVSFFCRKVDVFWLLEGFRGRREWFGLWSRLLRRSGA